MVSYHFMKYPEISTKRKLWPEKDQLEVLTVRDVQNRMVGYIKGAMAGRAYSKLKKVSPHTTK